MMASLRLFLVRHGMTEENLRGVVQGHRPGTLSEEGQRWAQGTGLRLRGVGIERIYTSDLARAVETARLMAEPLGVEVVPTPLLRERGYGQMEGRTRAELRLDYPDFYSVDMPERGVEPLAAVLDRLGRFLEGLRGDSLQCVLAVAHGGTNSYLTNLLLGEGRVMHPANHEVAYFHLDGGGQVMEHDLAWKGGP